MKASESSRHHPLLRQGASPRRLDWERSCPFRGRSLSGCGESLQGVDATGTNGRFRATWSVRLPLQEAVAPRFVWEAAGYGAEIHRSTREGHSSEWSCEHAGRRAVSNGRSRDDGGRATASRDAGVSRGINSSSTSRSGEAPTPSRGGTRHVPDSKVPHGVSEAQVGCAAETWRCQASVRREPLLEEAAYQLAGMTDSSGASTG